MLKKNSDSTDTDISKTLNRNVWQTKGTRARGKLSYEKCGQTSGTRARPTLVQIRSVVKNYIENLIIQEHGSIYKNLFYKLMHERRYEDFMKTSHRDFGPRFDLE